MSTPDHRFSRRRLEAFVDGELDEREAERVCLHLVDCPDCSDEVRMQMALLVALEVLGRRRAARR